MHGGSLRVLEIFGNSNDLGRVHGTECAGMIRKYLDTRIELTSQERWSGGVADRDLIIGTAEETLSFHEEFSESLYTEMVAMADAAGITPAEAVVVGGFTDLVDVVRSKVASAPFEHNCSAIINPAEGFLAQTWDMHASAGEFVIILKLDPLMGPAVVVQTTAGCLGQIGMNEAGIGVGINNLTSMGKPGVTWNFVVRKALEQTTLDAAIKVILDAELAGGHNYLVIGPDGEGANIEAMPLSKKVTRVTREPFVHTNHCLDATTSLEQAERLQVYVDDSLERHHLSDLHASDLESFFGHDQISRRAETPDEVGTCGAIIIEPQLRRMKSVWGIPGDHPWETFQL